MIDFVVGNSTLFMRGTISSQSGLRLRPSNAGSRVRAIGLCGQQRRNPERYTLHANMEREQSNPSDRPAISLWNTVCLQKVMRLYTPAPDPVYFVPWVRAHHVTGSYFYP
jgi:hypothetical protein